MAKQKGPIKIDGTLDDITFYKSKDGYLAKTKGGVSKERIKTDPRFIRTRENNEEFGSAAASGKSLRDAVRPMLKNASDFRVTSRLNRLMSEILKLDTTDPRGKRNVGVAIASPAAQAMLKGFEFNKNSLLGSVLFLPYAVNTATGVIKINGLVPINDLAVPQGATHVTFKCAFANVDFVLSISDIQYSNEVNLPIDGTSTNIVLTPVAVPAGAGTKVYLLQIEFFQLVNSVQYELSNGAFNALVIAAVA